MTLTFNNATTKSIHQRIVDRYDDAFTFFSAFYDNERELEEDIFDIFTKVHGNGREPSDIE